MLTTSKLEELAKALWYMSNPFSQWEETREATRQLYIKRIKELAEKMNAPSIEAQQQAAADERARIVGIIEAYSKSGMLRGITNSLIDAINRTE